MARSQDECIAEYPRSPLCNNRLYSRLLSWASYTSALPLPPTDTAPDIDWVRQHLLAARAPMYASMYLPQISPYTLEIPDVSINVRAMLNDWNSEATEASMSQYVDNALAVVMPKFAALVISDQDVINWCDDNGYPVPDLPAASALLMTLPGPGPRQIM